MAFPASLTLVTVTVQADLLPSGGSHGTCRIFYDGPLSGDTIVPYVDETTALVDGGGTLTVPATNAPGWAPLNFMYRVELRAGGTAWMGTLQLSYLNTAVTLADLVQWDGAVVAGVSYILASQKGVYGGVAALDASTGGVLDGDGNPVTGGGGGGGGIPETIVNAKGDLIAATAADTVTRLAVGSNGTALVAASGQTTGLQWAAPAPATHASTHASAGTDPVTLAESQVTNLVSDLAAKQPLDTDLTTIAGLTATTDNIIQSVGSAWASRTPAQVKTALAIAVTDVSGAAPLASPTFTGTPVLPTGTTAVTQTAADSTTAVATTAFVTTADNLKAPLASPTFTGTPAAPTASALTNTTQIATTAFVTTADALKANLASPTFTGTPTLPTGTIAVTQTASDSTTAVATTAFVTTADNLKAPLASPTFTGTPTLPTASALTNTTQIATTAFVTTADALKANLA